MHCMHHRLQSVEENHHSFHCAFYAHLNLASVKNDHTPSLRFLEATSIAKFGGK